LFTNHHFRQQAIFYSISWSCIWTWSWNWRME